MDVNMCKVLNDVYHMIMVLMQTVDSVAPDQPVLTLISHLAKGIRQSIECAV